MKYLSIFADNSKPAQYARMLDLLKMRAVSCLEACTAYAISDPLACVQALRKHFGHQIETAWVWQETESGKLQRIALYSLATKKGGAA